MREFALAFGASTRTVHEWLDCDRVAALFYSLIESAKLAGIEPRAYLNEAARQAIRNPGTATLARDLKSSESRGKPALDRLRAKTPEWRRTYSQITQSIHDNEPEKTTIKE